MTRNQNECFEAKRLASYSSHSGMTAKMWILPNGKAVSIPCQHYEWALEHEDYLKRRFSINLRYVRSRGDTAIRMHLLKHGCVRLNYERKGGRLTLEALHLHWGPRQIRGCRAVIRDNLSDIFFVLTRLLNNRSLVIEEEFTNLTDCSFSAAVKKLRLLRNPSLLCQGT